ncbi:MAG TPA: glycoside hydrolase family 3 C-terminal domain-containing protein, partial [Acidimicrobiales bacterium]|nr:glycoside hydrolase family 3 C-terminal domain-containing protein [Acidimicrobiales bacterium]
NRSLVVVLNTPGAVLMPWLGGVRAVLEAWYPGEEDGAATAGVLFGAVDPSGHLPVTFPASGDGVVSGSRSCWPGVDGSVEFCGGLDIGYRYDAARHILPLFAFGFGLSYTSFRLGPLVVGTTSGRVAASVRVTDSGRRSGADVVQAYLSFPPSAGEPPLQLVAFQRVELSPGHSDVVRLSIPASSFQAFLGSQFRTVRGEYTLRVGASADDLPLVATLSAPRSQPSTG